jgi:hypothetical protein
MSEFFSHSAWVVAGVIVCAKAGAVAKAAMVRATTVARDFTGFAVMFRATSRALEVRSQGALRFSEAKPQRRGFLQQPLPSRP